MKFPQFWLIRVTRSSSFLSSRTGAKWRVQQSPSSLHSSPQSILQNRDLSSSSGVRGLLSVFIYTCLALEVERKRECVACGGSVGDKVTTVLIGACSEGIR